MSTIYETLPEAQARAEAAEARAQIYREERDAEFLIRKVALARIAELETALDRIATFETKARVTGPADKCWRERAEMREMARAALKGEHVG